MNCIRQFLPHITLEVGPKCTRFFAPVVLDCKAMCAKPLAAMAHTTGTHPAPSPSLLPSLLGVEEDCTAIFGDATPRSAEQRRRYFKTESHRKAHYFETDHEYTFEFYQHSKTTRMLSLSSP